MTHRYILLPHNKFVAFGDKPDTSVGASYQRD